MLNGRCAVEEFDLAARPELVSWLLALRKDLEAANTGQEPAEARRLFYRL